MNTVFISYSREDLEQAVQVKKFIVANGFDVWIDVEKILPGQNWRSVIEEALDSVEFVVLCLSKTSVSKRGYVQREIRTALDSLEEMLDSDIYVIPLRLDDCELPAKLKKYQATDFFNSTGRKQLLNALQVGSTQRSVDDTTSGIGEEVSEDDEPVDLSSLGGGSVLNRIGFPKILKKD